MKEKIVDVTVIQFPEIKLATREGHKLRGFFGDLFRERSTLLHNHFEDGTLRYSYPLVQYKVVGGVPTLVAFNEGAELLVELFLKMKEIVIEDDVFLIFNKNILNKKTEISVGKDLYHYHLKTRWLAINQPNHRKYLNASPEEKKDMLNKIMVSHILSMYRGLGFETDEKVLVKGTFEEFISKFKNNDMFAFEGSFTSNALIPNLAGVGKSPSRGFGTVVSG